MNRVEISDRFADMWRRSREDAGKSQDYMAKALGVSKTTVQNWEAGTSCPTQSRGFEWFQALGLQPLSYYLEVIYPEFSRGGISSDEAVELALIAIVKDLPTHCKRKLLYELSGVHGSSVIGMIELVCAHLQTPLRDRVNIAQSVAINYEIASAQGKLRCMDHIQPDMELLHKAIGRGKAAVIAGKEEYTTEME